MTTGRHLFTRTCTTHTSPPSPRKRGTSLSAIRPAISTVDEAVELAVDEAGELANDSDYGLSASILGDVGMAMQIADGLESGKVHINEQTVADEAYAPFGSVKDSGNGGRLGGPAPNIEAFTETQW